MMIRKGTEAISFSNMYFDALLSLATKSLIIPDR